MSVNGTVSVSIGISARGRLGGSAGDDTFSAPFSVDLTAHTGGHAALDACHVGLAWLGSLSSALTEAGDSALLVDPDVFDGTPLLLVAAASPAPSDAQRDALAVAAASHMARVPARLDGLSAAASALTSSIRGAFLDSVSLSATPTASAVGRLWDDASASLSSPGTLYVFASSPAPGTLSPAVAATLETLFGESAGSACDVVSLHLATVSQSQAVALFVGDGEFRTLAVSASVGAVASCVRSGALVGSLSALLIASQPVSPRPDGTAWPPSFPSSLFASDRRAAVHMTKAVPLTCRGRLWGHVDDGVSVSTAVRGDLFTDDAAGRLVPDARLTDVAVGAIASAFAQAAQSFSVPGPLASLVGAALGVDLRAAAVAFRATCAAPTVIRFLDAVAAQQSPAIDRLRIAFPSPAAGLSMNITLSLGAHVRAPVQSLAAVAWAHDQIASGVGAVCAGLSDRFGAAVRQWACPSLDGARLTSGQVVAVMDASATLEMDLSSGVARAVQTPAVTARTLLTAALSFSQTTSLLASAAVRWDSNSGSVSVSADVSTLARRVLPEEAWRAGVAAGIFSTNARVLAAQLADAAKAVHDALAGVSWVGRALQPTTLVAGMVTDGAHLSDVWDAISNSLRSLAPTRGLFRGIVGAIDVQDAVASALSAKASAGLGVASCYVANVAKAGQDAELSFSLTATHVQPLSISEASWPMLATSRIRATAALHTSLSFTLSGSSVSNFATACSASAEAEGWSAAFRNDMLAGRIESGSARVSIALTASDPLAASLDIGARISLSDQDGVARPLVLSVSGLGIAVDDGASSVDVTRAPRVDIQTDSPFRVAPSVMLSMLREAIGRVPSRLSSGAFGVPLAPLQAPSLDKLVASWDAMVDTSLLPWAAWMRPDTTAVAVQSDVCARDLSLPARLTLVVNSAVTYNCDVTSLPTDNLKSLVAALDKIVAACVPDGLLSARLVSVEKDRDDCGSFALFPRVPGAVWRLDLSNSLGSSTKSVFTGQRTFVLPSIPSFASWPDFAVAATVSFGDWGSLVVRPWLHPTDAVQFVPAELASLYPATLPSVGVDVGLSLTHVFTPPADEAASSKFAVDGAAWASVTMDGSALVSAVFNATVDAGVGLVFDVPPPAQLWVSTCFDAEAILPTAVVLEGASFILSVTAEHRFPGVNGTSPTRRVRQFSATVTLTPGAAVWDALLAQVTPQLSPELSSIVSVVAVNASVSPGLSTVPQLRLVASRAASVNGSWLLPYAIAVASSSVAALSNSTQTPTVPRAVLPRMSASVAISAEAQAASASGHLGVLELTAKNAGVSGRASFSVHCGEAVDANAAVIAMGDAARIGSIFSSSWSVEAEAHVGELSFGTAQLQLPILEGVSFRVSANATSPSTDLMVAASANWTLTLSHPLEEVVRAYEQLAALNYSTFCGWMDAALLVRGDLVGFPAASAPLPFLTRAVSAIAQDGVGRIMEDARARACDQHQSWTVSLLCAVLDAEFGTGACNSVSLTPTSLTVELTSSAARSYADRFRLDFAWLGLGREIPIGLGFPGSVSVNGTFNVLLRLRADWSSGSIHLDVAPGSFVRAGVAAEIKGAVELAIGPVASRFGNMNAAIGSQSAPAALEARVGDDGKVAVSLSGAARMSGSLTALSEPVCDLRVRVALADALDASAWAVAAECDPDFAGAWARVMERFGSALLNYFRNAMVVMSQLQDAFDAFSQQLARIVPDWIVPLVDRAIADAISTRLDDIIGRDARQGIVTELTEFTNGLLLNHTGAIDYNLLDQILVDGFTFIMCKHLKPDTCPPAPDASADELTWPLQWTDTLRPPIPAVHFGLGGSGFAQLDFNCDPALTIDFAFRVTLVLSKTKGLSLRFDRNPVLHAGVAFALDADCGLEGRLGFVSAVLQPDPASGVSGALSVTHANNTWAADFNVDAVLKGELDIGLAGKLKGRLSEDVAALQALPYIRIAQMDIEWHWSLAHPSVTPPTIHFGGVSFCVGSFVSHMLASVKQKLDVVLKPLDKVIGPNSLLMSKVGEPAKIMFGRDMTLLEFLHEVERTQCEGSCAFDGVFEALDALADVERILAKVDALLSLADCVAWSQIQSFHFDPSQQQPQPVPDRDSPATTFPQLSFVPDVDPDHVGRVTEVWSSVTEDTGDDYGFHLLLKAKDIPKYVLDLIMGTPFDICELRLRAFRISVGMASWQVLVWPWPSVWLGVDVSAQLVLTPPTVVYTSRGISKFIASGRPADMAAGLGMRARNSDGSPYWPLQATVRVGGFVGVGFGWGPAWVEGDAELFLEAVGKLGLVTAYGDPVVYFDQIYWIMRKNGFVGALALEFDLNGGVEVRLRACVSVVFGKKCWTLASHEWKETLFHVQTYTPSLAPAVCSDHGVLNLNLGSFGRRDVEISDVDAASRDVDDNAWTFQLHEKDGMRTHGLLPPGDGASVSIPSNSRDIPASVPISFGGDAGSTPFTCKVLTRLSQPVQFPAGTSGSVHLLVNGDRSVGRADLSPAQLKTSPAAQAASGTSVLFATGASIGSRCRSVVLDQPVGGMAFSVTGVPCATNIGSDTTSFVALSGEPADYAAQPVSVASTQLLHVTVAATDYRMRDAAVVGDHGALNLALSEPEGVTNMHVASHPTRPSLLVIESLPEYRRLEPRGGAGDDVFAIPDMFTISGYLNMSGAESRNTLNVTMFTPPTGLNASLTPAVVMMDASHARRSATFSDIKRRFLTVYGKSDATSTVKLLGAEDLSLVRVFGIGDGNSTMVYPVTECDPLSRIDLDLQGGGTHTVLIGRDNVIKDVTCTIAVAGGVEEGQVNTIVMQSRSDGRPYQFVLHSDKVLVYDALDTREFMTVYHENIHRFIFQFSNVSGVYSRVTVVTPTPRTEMHFDFPTQPTGAPYPNHITVCRSLAPSVITGSYVDAVVGPDQYDLVCNSQLSADDDDPLAPNPLFDIHGSVYVLNTGTDGRSNVSLHSFKDGSQGFTVGPLCVEPVLPDGRPSGTRSTPNGPSDWLCDVLTQHGAPSELCSANCTLAYTGPMDVFLRTGAGGDYLYGQGLLPSATFNVSLGSGRDKVVWAQSAAATTLDLGTDSDQLIVEAPTQRLHARLGDDDVIDAVDVWCGSDSPHVVNGVVWPLGPSDGDVLSLEEYRIRDQLNVRAGLPLVSPAYGRAFGMPLDAPKLHVGGPLHPAELRRRDAEGTLQRLSRSAVRDGDVSYIVMNVTGGVLRRDLLSNATVIVVEMENQCTLSLNADSPQEGVAPPTGWRVGVQLPALRLFNLIVVESTLGSDGEVHVVIPDADQKSLSNDATDAVDPYAISLSLAQPSNYLVFETGGLTLKTTNLPHLRTSLLHASTVTVNHPLAWPEYVFDTTLPGSEVLLSAVGNNVLLSGVRARLEGPLLRTAFDAGFGFAAAGLLTDVSVMARDAGVSLAHVIDDCVSLNFTASPAHPRAASSWFVGVSAEFGMRPEAVSACLLALHNTSVVEMFVDTVNASDLDAVRNTALLYAHSAAVHLAETRTPWASADLAGDNITVAGRFTLAVDHSTRVDVAAPFRPVAAPFRSNCGAAGAMRHPTTWTFVDPADTTGARSAMLRWSASGCGVSVAVPDAGFAPAIAVSDFRLKSIGAVMSSAQARAGTYRRHVDIQPSSLSAVGEPANVDEQPIALATLTWSANTPLSLDFADGHNTLSVRGMHTPLTAAHVSVAGGADSLTLDVPMGAGVEFTGGSVFMSAHSGVLEVLSSSASACFDADRVCTAGFWIAAATLGSQVCISEPALNECEREKAVSLSLSNPSTAVQFDARFSCSASAAGTTLRFGRDADLQPHTRYDAWIALMFFFFIASALLSVVAWLCTRQWPMFASHLVLSAALMWPAAMRVNEPSTAAAVVLASRKAVFGLLTPWYCGADAIAEGTADRFATAMAALCVAFAVIAGLAKAASVLARRLEGGGQWRVPLAHVCDKIAVVLVALYVFVFMPSHVFHLSRFGWTPLDSVSVVALTAVLALFVHASVDVEGDIEAPFVLEGFPGPLSKPGTPATRGRVLVALNCFCVAITLLACIIANPDLAETGRVTATSSLGAAAIFLILLHCARVASVIAWNDNTSLSGGVKGARALALANVVLEVTILALGLAFIGIVGAGTAVTSGAHLCAAWMMLSLLWVVFQYMRAFRHARSVRSANALRRESAADRALYGNRSENKGLLESEALEL